MTLRTVQWPEDRAALFAHLRTVYSAPEVQALAGRYEHIAAHVPADCLVMPGPDPDTISGHGLIVSRHLQIGAATLPTAEIAALAVQPAAADDPDLGPDPALEHALLEALHARVDARGDVLCLAFGAPYLYERWHYEYAAGLYFTSYNSTIDTAAALKAGTWDRAHSYERRTADRLRAPSRPASVRRFYLDDLPSVSALYAAESTPGHYLIARDATTWNTQIDHLALTGHGEPDDFLVAEREGQIVAYLRLVTTAPVNYFRPEESPRVGIIEACGVDSSGLEGLLHAAGGIAHALGESEIGLYVHPASAFMQHALARGATQRYFTGAALMRLHRLGPALEALVPALEERRLNSRFRERAYRLAITTEHDHAEITLGMGDPAPIELEVPTTTLVRLITGWYGLDHLTMGYHERYADVLRVLFPMRDPKLGIADLI